MTQKRRPSNHNRPMVSRPGATGLRFGMFAVCVSRDSDPGLNKGKAKALYPLLVAYADVTSRSTAQGYPYRSALADALDCTKDTIDNATKYLENEIGLIKVVRRKVEGQPDQNDANEYRVFDSWLIQGCAPTPDTPPQLVARYGATVPGFDVDAWIVKHAPSFDLAGWRSGYEETLRAQEAKREAQRRKEAARRKPKKKGNEGGGGMSAATPEGAEEQGGGGTGSATRGGTDSARGGGMSAALSRAVVPETSSPDSDAPSGGVGPVGARSASPTGSREADREGGFAASSKIKHTRQQLNLARQVRAYYPEHFLRGWTNPGSGEKTKPLPELPEITQAILDALEGDAPGADRTPAQLGARIQQRWNQHGYAAAFYAGELENPVGAAIAMVRPLKPTDRDGCGNPRCDAGRDVDTYEPCTVCPERLAARKAKRRQEQAQAAAGEAGPSVSAASAEGPSLPPQRSEKRRCDGCGNIFGPGADPAVSTCRTCRDEQAETERIRAELAMQFGTAEQREAYAVQAPF